MFFASHHTSKLSRNFKILAVSSCICNGNFIGTHQATGDFMCVKQSWTITFSLLVSHILSVSCHKVIYKVFVMLYFSWCSLFESWELRTSSSIIKVLSLSYYIWNCRRSGSEILPQDCSEHLLPRLRWHNHQPISVASCAKGKKARFFTYLTPCKGFSPTSSG